MYVASIVPGYAPNLVEFAGPRQNSFEVNRSFAGSDVDGWKSRRDVYSLSKNIATILSTVCNVLTCPLL